MENSYSIRRLFFGKWPPNFLPDPARHSHNGAYPLKTKFRGGNDRSFRVWSAIFAQQNLRYFFCPILSPSIRKYSRPLYRYTPMIYDSEGSTSNLEGGRWICSVEICFLWHEKILIRSIDISLHYFPFLLIVSENIQCICHRSLNHRFDDRGTIRIYIFMQQGNFIRFRKLWIINVIFLFSQFLFFDELISDPRQSIECYFNVKLLIVAIVVPDRAISILYIDSFRTSERAPFEKEEEEEEGHSGRKERGSINLLSDPWIFYQRRNSCAVRSALLDSLDDDRGKKKGRGERKKEPPRHFSKVENNTRDVARPATRKLAGE